MSCPSEGGNVNRGHRETEGKGVSTQCTVREIVSETGEQEVNLNEGEDEELLDHWAVQSTTFGRDQASDPTVFNLKHAVVKISSI